MNTAAISLRDNRLVETLTVFMQGFRAHALLYFFAGLASVLAVGESVLFDLPVNLKMVFIFTGPVLGLLAGLIYLGLAYELHRLHRSGYEGRLLYGMWLKLNDDYFSPQRVANALHACLFMTMFMAGYGSVKEAIPHVVPYSWDETFMQWDKFIHFGRQPYEWLAPILNFPLATFLVNLNYNIWFFVMFTCWFWQGFSKADSPLRQRFLLSFALTWFLGGCILATIFSSGGPCFYGKLLPGPDPYAPLMANLNEATGQYTIWSLTVMDTLWRNYETGAGSIVGISAMPSLHTASATLFALLGYASGKKWLGHLLSVFAFLILVGCVHLGWHYAIDGYAGMAIAVTCWWLAGRLVNWDRRNRGLA
jgi:membrane-associated phospholipid phosphatase